MKKLITITVIIIVAACFLVAGSTRAEAMHNEREAALTAGMFLLGIPFMHAIAQEAIHHEHAYRHDDTPRYIERTKVVYVEPRYERMHRYRHHNRNCRHGWDSHEDRRGHDDSRRDSGRHNDSDRRR